MFHCFVTAMARSGSTDVVLRSGRAAATAYAALDLAVESMRRQLANIAVATWPHAVCVQLWATVLKLTEEEGKFLFRQQRVRDAAEEMEHQRHLAEDLKRSRSVEPLVDEEGTIIVTEDPNGEK
jgi:hypothetical protein